ncbi:hypothetical protein PVK22_29350 (plasmid) [Klebsiella oxytoca]|uniref:hypothetical protein n=1 Tax=Klebsiella oxytoca TaxID=571 RepID=UPI002342D162|nr:hypothetical protein [Klebsiella oxytoca]EKY3945938.1 hypothetical protein [Enterobacter hormaechei]WGZ96769.1 hypothetical protein QJQ59_01700 [Klebsiella michiganensis]EGT0049203.1 hypothetical protein [Klebsiella oxytoca]WBT21259.1 hypothetical protein PF584_32365 [Klebsiella oxytoca]WDQ09083.1 hypothetical protein PVK22_29350 [Klebsiella oxytoca]
MKKMIVVPVFLLLASCSLGLSLDERYQQAYGDVVREPTAENVERYMKLSQEVFDRDMHRANLAAEQATIESDKGFTEYFKKYGSDEFKKSRQ